MLNIFLKKCLANGLYNGLQTRIRYSCKLPAIVMNNGNEMPIIGMGTYSETGTECDSQGVKINAEKVAKVVECAIDVGYRHIDCAHLYKKQREIGQVLKKKIDTKVVARENVFITSKLWNTSHDPSNVCKACKQTLEELELYYLDMYLMHTPMGFEHSNDLFPMCNGELLCSDVDYIGTWHAMEDLVEKKLCKNIGISNFNMQQIKRLLKNCKIIPQILQIEVHPYMTQKKLVHFVKSHDICVTTYAPLGLLARSPCAETDEERNMLTDYKILQLAEKHKRSPAQILLRYQIQSGHAVIPAATEIAHIAEYFDIFDFELCPEDIINIESLNHNLRYFKFTGASGHIHHPFENTKEVHTNS